MIRLRCSFFHAAVNKNRLSRVTTDVSTFSTIKAGMTYNAAVASVECSSSSTSVFTCTSTALLYVCVHCVSSIPPSGPPPLDIPCRCLKCSVRFAPSSSGSSIFGGISFGSTYYVQSIPSSSTFSISNTRGGAQRALTAGTRTDFAPRTAPAIVTLLLQAREV